MITITKITNEIFTLKWVLFIVPTIIYGWISQQSILQASTFLQARSNQWDIIMYQLSDPIFLLFIYLPFVLTISCKTICNCLDNPILIRVHSWRKFVLFSLKSFIQFVLVSIILLLVVSLIFTSSSDYALQWSSFSMSTENIYNITSSVLQQTGFSPLLILFLHLVQLATLVLVLHVLMTLFYIFFPNLVFLSLFAFLIFVYAITSFKYLPYPKFSLFNYMTSFSSLTTFGSLIYAILILLSILVFLLFFVVRLKELRFFYLKGWFTKNCSYLVYIILCLFGLISPFVYSDLSIGTVWDNLYLRFYGLSLEENISLTLFLYYIVVYIGFVYIIQTKISEYLSERFYYTSIRYQSLWNWFRSYSIRLGVGIFSFLIVLMVLTILVSLFTLDLKLQFKVTVHSDLTVTHVLYHFIINGWLQITNYILIIFIVSWLFGESAYRLISLSILILTALPYINRSRYLPSGLNAMGLLDSNWNHTLNISTILIFWLLIQLLVIGFLFFKKNMAFK